MFERNKIFAVAFQYPEGVVLTGTSTITLRQFLQADAAIFHLTTVTFQSNGAVCGNLQRGFEEFVVAGAVRLAAVYGDNNFIPILRLVTCELLVRPGDEVVLLRSRGE